MTRIVSIAHYIPEGHENNFDKREKFGIDDVFIEKKLGVCTVSRKLDNEDTSDMCVKAYAALSEADRPESVDCLIVCTQNPDGRGIPHTSAIVHGKLGLNERCACFDISLGCSGYVYSLSVIKSFMESNGFRVGLLFTADPYSKIINPDDKNTAMLFGDAATVTVLDGTNTFDGFELGQFIFDTRGNDWKSLHNSGGFLSMNGRAVFNFALTSVPRQINELLQKSGLALEDVDVFLMHQGSRFIVEQLAKRMKLSSNQVRLQLKDHGNTVSSSIPLMLETILKNGSENTIVMSGFGVGFSWASCIARRKTHKR